MQGVEISHLNAALLAALNAYYDFLYSTVEDALRPIAAYGKGDTLGMDAGPEITICGVLGRYDVGAVIVTEEIGSSSQRSNDTFLHNDPQTFRTVFISDPTDRSNQLKEFLTKFDRSMRIRKILQDPSSLALWEKNYGAPVSISGATSAISCIRRGIPIFSVIVNYITQELFVACAAGNRLMKLPPEKTDTTLAQVLKQGQPVVFPTLDGEFGSMRRFVAFMGDAGKAGYFENIRDSNIMSPADVKTFSYSKKPGGPSRILYLSTLQPRNKPIGFILANGEKIGEWIHWLSFARFVRSQGDESQPALIMYEMFQERPWTKEGVLMSTPPNYSVFREYKSNLFIDTSWLLRMPNPSRLRSMVMIAPYDNRWAVRSASQSGYREIKFENKPG